MAMPQSTPLTVSRLLAPALTLAERLAVFREHGHLLGEGELDTSLGRRWLDKLKAIPPFEQVPSLWEQFLEAWDGVVDREHFDEHRERFSGVAAAYHTVSYAGIVTRLEPSTCAMIASGLQSFFRQLDAAVPS